MAKQARIASIRLVGVHEHQELTANFKPGLNILHGKNGSGKTTLLHVLANLLEGDLYRFCNIRFRRLFVKLYDGTEISLEQPGDQNNPVVQVCLRGENLGTLSRETPVPEPIAKSIRELFPDRPVYLPAFRSILEAADEREQQYAFYRESIEAHTEFAAIKTNEERYNRVRPRSEGRILDNPGATASKTLLSRRWFGEFVPIVRYPSLADVSRQLKNEFEQAYYRVNRKNQETFSTVFGEVLQVLEKRVPHAGIEVRTLLSRVQTHLQSLTSNETHGGYESGDNASLFESGEPLVTGEEESIQAILKTYDSALSKRAAREEEAYKGLRLLEESFNLFVKPKKLRIVTPNARGRGGPIVNFPNNYSAKLGVLSSGERQVLTMLFCATHMSPADGIMLIDEPEISLHVDWQRIILNEIMRQAGDRQIIACTHSPEVVAEHRDALIELSSKAWSSGQSQPVEADTELESISGD